MILKISSRLFVQVFAFFLLLITINISSYANALGVVIDDAEKGRVIVFRPKQPQAISAVYYRIFSAGKSIGKLKNNKQIVLQLAPGKYYLSANDGGDSPIEIDVRAGVTTYVQAVVKRKPDYHLHMQVVPEKQAMVRMPDLALL